MNTKENKLWYRIKKNTGLYVLLLPAVIIMFMFTYQPMAGIVIAFKDFVPVLGIWESEWVGFKYFEQFFNSFQFETVITNTITISIYSILITFPLPIAFAILCNQITNTKFKKFFQVSTYLPHFISTVVMSGMIILFLSPSSGVIAQIAGMLGFELPNLLGIPSAFADVYVWTEVWQHVGWDSILYIAALSAIDPSLHEAATVDGASKWQKITKIDLPLLLPTATIMLILRAGTIMNVGFEKVYLLQNRLNEPASEIIATYIYKVGLISSQYSLSSAVNLFNNLINLILLLTVNAIASKMSKNSLM